MYEPYLLPSANYTLEVKNTQQGYVHRILAEEIGVASLILGGGRVTKESEIDLGVGILLKKKRGDVVAEGDTLAVIYANDMQKAIEAYGKIVNAYNISEEQPESCPMIKKIISE